MSFSDSLLTLMQEHNSTDWSPALQRWSGGGPSRPHSWRGLKGETKNSKPEKKKTVLKKGRLHAVPGARPPWGRCPSQSSWALTTLSILPRWGQT